MYARDELAEVYSDFAPVPLYGLIDLVLAALEGPDAADLESFRKKQAADGGRNGPLCPADLLDALTLLIDADFPGRTIQWHLQRALHVKLHFSESRLARRAERVLTDHRPFIGKVAAGDPGAFLYTGLRVERLVPEVVEHIEAWVDRDLEVALYLARSGHGAAPLGPETLGRAATVAVTEILKEATTTPNSVGTVILRTQPKAFDLVPWLSWLLRQHPSAFAHVRGVSLPERIIAGWPLAGATAPDALELGRPGDVDSSRCLLDFEGICLPESVDDAVRLVISIARAHPLTTPALAGVLHARFAKYARRPDAAPTERPSDEGVRELVALDPAFFHVVIDARWLDALRDAADLVGAAAALDDVGERAAALSAIGRPARDQLGALVDELLSKLATEPDCWAPVHGKRLAELADGVACLGLPFWEKRLTRPRAFTWLSESVRLREALAVHPEPVYRLVRRATRKEPEVAVEALRALLPSLDTFPLAPIAAEVVALVGGDCCRLDWPARLCLLSHAGSAEAREAALQIARGEDTDEDELIRVASQDAAVWNLLVGAGTSVTAPSLVDALLDNPVSVCAPAAIAAVDALLDRVLGPPSQPPAKWPIVKNTDVLIAILHEHHVALGAERPNQGLARLKEVLAPEAFVGLTAATATHKDNRVPPPLPWSHLFDSDLGHVLPEIGRWFADRVTEAVWMRHDLGKVLRPAIVARYRDALGERGDEIIVRLGEHWPTQAAVVKVAGELGISVDAAAAARCADEAVPPIFRAALTRLPRCIEGSEASRWSDEHWIVRWVFESVWPDAPELLARHIAAVFVDATDATWRRGLALSLVALREPCGTTVPDALTAAAHSATTDDERDFFKRQRDTFARAHAAHQQDVPGDVRSREALHRIRRFAMKARGVQ